MGDCRPLAGWKKFSRSIDIYARDSCIESAGYSVRSIAYENAPKKIEFPRKNSQRSMVRTRQSYLCVRNIKRIILYRAYELALLYIIFYYYYFIAFV